MNAEVDSLADLFCPAALVKGICRAIISSQLDTPNEETSLRSEIVSVSFGSGYLPKYTEQEQELREWSVVFQQSVVQG